MVSHTALFTAALFTFSPSFSSEKALEASEERFLTVSRGDIPPAASKILSLFGYNPTESPAPLMHLAFAALLRRKNTRLEDLEASLPGCLKDKLKLACALPNLVSILKNSDYQPHRMALEKLPDRPNWRLSYHENYLFAYNNSELAVYAMSEGPPALYFKTKGRFIASSEDEKILFIERNKKPVFIKLQNLTEVTTHEPFDFARDVIEFRNEGACTIYKDHRLNSPVTAEMQPTIDKAQEEDSEEYIRLSNLDIEQLLQLAYTSPNSYFFNANIDYASPNSHFFTEYDFKYSDCLDSFNDRPSDEEEFEQSYIDWLTKAAHCKLFRQKVLKECKNVLETGRLERKYMLDFLTKNKIEVSLKDLDEEYTLAARASISDKDRKNIIKGLFSSYSFGRYSHFFIRGWRVPQPRGYDNTNAVTADGKYALYGFGPFLVYLDVTKLRYMLLKHKDLQISALVLSPCGKFALILANQYEEHYPAYVKDDYNTLIELAKRRKEQSLYIKILLIDLINGKVKLLLQNQAIGFMGFSKKGNSFFVWALPNTFYYFNVAACIKGKTFSQLESISKQTS